MANSLIEELPKIIKRGRREANKLLEGLSDENRLTLQTNELVLPSKDVSGFFKEEVKEINENQWINKLIYGDNLLTMQALLAGDEITPSMRGKIDLIYIDPPYDSKADYRTEIVLPSQNIEQRPTVIEQFAYKDTWKNGTVSYLEMMVPRLILMRELLSESGSIFVHIDWHVGHYLKIILDDIFGKNNFNNEIIWHYGGPSPVKSTFPKKHDTILFYSKNIKNAYFEPQYSEIKEYLYERAREDADGRKWVDQNVGKITEEKFNELKSKGYIFKTKTGKYRRKQYLDEMKGDMMDNVWEIPIINSQAQERLNFQTQKPEALIEKIVGASCPPGGVVADFFMGSGTTGAVAEKMGRKWVMADLGKPATMITRKRLIDQEAKPFLYQSIGDYQKEQFEQSEFKTIRDLSHVVMSLFGALPFNDNESRTNLGYLKKDKTLVLVDSPSKLTGYTTLIKAQKLRNTYQGGWDKVVVLGWNFVQNIGQIISDLNDKRLNVLVIPPDLLEQLKTKSKAKKLIQTGNLRFSSLQYLTVKEPVVEMYNDELETLTVELDNYVLLSPEALPLDDKNKKKLSEIIANDPLALIEYWSIDPNYDGLVFRSKWQDYRENTSNDNDEYRVINKAKINVPKVNGKRTICVKAVDVFGFESATTFEIKG
ncbi:site-specific DNA-methyltransferase [uncultured Methanobrevibacter sp.]|uniref:site-specific DNA-methyltransferase n=1 Tax=uncultured Methanobrevibacter sp. TaxID=253161 RepID=UPI00261A52AA|nr:DNA methyltransferase [uncultured Methanobrevibacter sp.]